MNIAADHMHETLVPSPTIVAAAALKNAAGDRSVDQDNIVCYSVLTISSPTNQDIRSVWHGDETVSDPGITCQSRKDAFKACEVLEAEGAQATAYVVHWVAGYASVWINP